MVHPKILEALRKRGSVSPLFKCPRVDFGKLKSITKRPIKDFHIYSGIGNLKRVNTVQGPYFYRDNGAKILVVAHLDSVLSPHWAGVLNYKDDTHIYASTLDNRLGVYVALELLQKAGLEYDILLTTNEENGNSTAQWFEPPQGKKYNWIVSFDRKGDDVVTYAYNDMDWHRALRSVGFHIGVGSYSCISDLDHLGASGVNIGIGFHDYHSRKAYASLNEIREQVSKFLRFYSEYYDVEFGYTPKLNTVSKGGLRFAYDVIGRFSDEELQLAVDFYEQLQDGATFAELGFPHQSRITKDDIASMIKSGRKLSRLEVVQKDGEQIALAFPKTKEGAIETEKLVLDGGHQASLVERCVECGSFFETTEPHTEPYCSTCKEVIANRHAVDDVDPAHITRDEKEVVKDWLNKYPEDDHPSVENDNEGAMIASAKIWLQSPKVTAEAIGTCLRMVREHLPEKKVKEVYDKLIDEKKLRPFRVNKLTRSNYPPSPNGKVILTLKTMGVLIDSVGVDLSKTSSVSNKKWLSKLELGHRGLWAYKKDLEPLDDYLLLLSDYANEAWIEVIDLISKVNIEPIVSAIYAKYGLPAVKDDEETEKNKNTEKETEKQIIKTERIPNPIIKLKYRLDASDQGYDFHSTIGGGIEFGWEKVTKELVRPKLAS